MKHYRSTNSAVIQAFAVVLGVCLLVTPLKNDRINSTPADKIKEIIINGELEEDKYGAEKLK